MSAFLLRVGDGGDPPSFATVAGLTLESEVWNGVDLVITGKGTFTGSAAETRVKNNWRAVLLDSYELSFEDGRLIRGQFEVTGLDYIGAHIGDRSYSITLSGAAEVVDA